MAQNSGTTFVSELTRVSVYKRSQGKRARLLTSAAIALITFLGAMSLQRSFLMGTGLSEALGVPQAVTKWGIPGLICAVGFWIAFRVIHHERFAEFLISTESEVEKVQWPDRQHVHRATIVVIVTMLLMGALLFVFDFIWQKVFSFIGFLEFID